MEQFTSLIEQWYTSNQRSLPWREAHDAYRIWISEIILQQTRVVQGLTYYERFLRRYPTLQALAEATEDEVLQLWQGLGYYSRARNMLKAAQMMAQGGGFPTTYDEVRRLPGIGDYTAAAVCSFAYNLPYPAIDGNMLRVLSRYFAVSLPIDKPEGKRAFRELAERLLDKRHPGLFNQALMDFGATLCMPRAPLCDHCPLASHCGALSERRVADYPVKSHTVKVRRRYLLYIYVKRGDQILLHRRSKGDIWQGLYEPLTLELNELPDDTAVGRELKVYLTVPGAKLRRLKHDVRHILTHQELHADFYMLTFPAEGITPVFPEGYQFVPESQRADYAVSRLVELLYESL